MNRFEVASMRNSNVAYIHRMRDQIRLDPPYQRQGAVWSTEKKRLLIDSLLNDFDIPKIYLHEHPEILEVDGRRVRYSLIDGRQRLEAIWGFLDGQFALADDFELLENSSKDAAGKTYTELVREGDDLAPLLTSINLDICVIRTGDIDLIEEMFSRLNEAVPLNAAEKRNGRGGVLRSVVRDLVENQFFVDKLPFENTRYRHYDLALKFVVWAEKGHASDTKKRQLDEFWDDRKDDDADALVAKVAPVVGALAEVFEDDDHLLTSIGMISVYFLSTLGRIERGDRLPSRAELDEFQKVRRLDSFESEESLGEFEKDLLEFDRLAQSPNDGHALEFRVKVLDRFLDESQ